MKNALNGKYNLYIKKIRSGATIEENPYQVNIIVSKIHRNNVKVYGEDKPTNVITDTVMYCTFTHTWNLT